MGKTFRGNGKDKAKKAAKKRKQIREGKKLSAISVVLLSAFFASLIGCKTAGTAARIEQRKVVGITSATIGEYTIPVISISEGPSVSVYQTKDAPSAVTIEGSATTTNRTSVLGIYDSEEKKTMMFTGTFKLVSTNSVTNL